MDVFFDEFKEVPWYSSIGIVNEILGYESTEKFDFNFIKHIDRHRMIVLIKDIEEIAEKNNMFNHTIDPKVRQQIDDLWARREQENETIKAM